MSAWGWTVGVGLFVAFALIVVTGLELRGPTWAVLVAKGIMWTAFAALVWWLAKLADARANRRNAELLRQAEQQGR